MSFGGEENADVNIQPEQRAGGRLALKSQVAKRLLEKARIQSNQQSLTRQPFRALGDGAATAETTGVSAARHQQPQLPSRHTELRV